MLLKCCTQYASKFGKVSSTWTENFQVYKLDLEKAGEPESNFQHLLDHRESKGIPGNIYFCFIAYAKDFDCVDHNKLWNILEEMGIPDHLSCFLRNLYAGQEATVRTEDETMDWFKIGKGVRQGWILSPCLFNLYAEYIMRDAGLDEAPPGIKLQGETSITSDM